MIRLFKVAMSPEAKRLVGEVLDSGYIGQGPRVEEFERRLSQVLGGEVLTTNSCTSAIDLALHLCGVGPGDEVISTPMSCTATTTMAVNRRARIVWADVNPTTGLINPHDVKVKVTRSTKAIIVVAWGGRPVEHIVDAIRERFDEFDVPIIVDAAHSLVRRELILGSEANFVTWSFQAIKFLTTGDGGALFVRGDGKDRARLLRWYGLDRTSGESFRCQQTIHEAGYKYHMNDVAAAIGLANLDLAIENVERHRANARYYHEALKSFPPGLVELPPPDEGSSWWLYTILVNDRDGFIERMRERGVECSPVHAPNDKHPAFRGWGHPLPGLARFAAREVAIPVGWWLTEEDRQRVVDAVKECAR